MKYVLTLSYRWMVVSEGGLLKTPLDRWGDSHRLSKAYASREDAIGDYCRFINEGRACPDSLILVEQHTKNINWDE